MMHYVLNDADRTDTVSRTNGATNTSTVYIVVYGDEVYLEEERRAQLERFRVATVRWALRDEYRALRAQPQTAWKPPRVVRRPAPTPRPRACPVRHRSRQYWRRGYR